MFDYMEGYFAFGVPKELLQGSSFEMVCTGFSVTVIWSALPLEYCTVKLYSNGSAPSYVSLGGTLPIGSHVNASLLSDRNSGQPLPAGIAPSSVSSTGI